MNKYITFSSALKTGVVFADDLKAAAILAGLDNATVCDDVAFQWFCADGQSFAVEVVQA